MTSELTDPALPGPALLRRPDQVRAAIVALPGAEQGERVQPLFEHLSATLQPLGYAVLSYPAATGEPRAGHGVVGAGC